MTPTDVEIADVRPERTAAFRAANEREALSTMWNFRVVWHEQDHEIAALRGEAVVGVLRLRIAASLAHVESFFVTVSERRRGIGRAMLSQAESLAKYYNCHKMTVQVPAELPARRYFEACDYRVEAILPQHTWKLDVAILRKFLL